MTHTPPIPEANQSPYPIKPEPQQANSADAPPPGDPRIARTPEPKHDKPVPVAALIAAGIGVGLAAIAGGAFFALRNQPKPKKKPKKRKAPQA